ncbi:MAG: hypothetical protein ABI844_07800 [Saprospiraceae bacterium]
MKMHLLFVLISSLIFIMHGFPVSAQNTGDTQQGKSLFVGNVRFINQGPACNSCHNVDMEEFISGGALAKDLTQAVTRLSADGVKGIIAGMPFPQMQKSYEGKPLTEQEISNLLAFLKSADTVAATTQPTNPAGKDLMTGGIVGAIVLLILFSFFWIRRKQRPVNYLIFKRQTKSA